MPLGWAVPFEIPAKFLGAMSGCSPGGSTARGGFTPLHRLEMLQNGDWGSLGVAGAGCTTESEGQRLQLECEAALELWGGEERACELGPVSTAVPRSPPVPFTPILGG